MLTLNNFFENNGDAMFLLTNQNVDFSTTFCSKMKFTLKAEISKLQCTL